jgi:hypothetical protein
MLIIMTDWQNLLLTDALRDFLVTWASWQSEVCENLATKALRHEVSLRKYIEIRFIRRNISY